MTTRPGRTSSIPEPDWLSGLVIYEIATRGFTSPKGPESGTFASCAERIPYLRDLGVTGIWLTGHNWADESHFYNIWTQYATLRPDVIDACLGTAEEFRRLVDTAHAHGIRVFLDVITHGVMNGSPLVKEHPEWFTGGTWGMTDYDWFGDHEDLFRWWVETWVGYVTRFGIDGYRLDVSMYRPDLWQQIKRRASDAGHPIVVFHECGPGRRGVADFLQWGIRLKFNTEELDQTKPLITDMPATIRSERANDHPPYVVTVTLADGTLLTSGPSAGALRVEEPRKESRVVENPRAHDAYGEDLAVLEAAGLPAASEVASVKVKTGPFYEWNHPLGIAADYTLDVRRTGDRLTLRFPRRSVPEEFLSLQLSCHDDGWEGFARNRNPYVAQGSRFVFGYACLFTPAIPIFMAGEEFDADYVPLPRLSPKLFGGAEPGSGTWLYGSWLQWSQLEQPRHRDMLEDVRAMIALRKRHARLIRPLRREAPIEGFFSLDGQRPASLPVPYAYCDADTLLVIAGNPSADGDAQLVVPLPWSSLPMKPAKSLRVQDVWAGTPARTMAASDLETLSMRIPRDNVRRGGLAIWEITRTR